tara:strand:+ start:719 stop:1216 length:498 start_codon:yes stop_codon:yes gene_type:complete
LVDRANKTGLSAKQERFINVYYETGHVTNAALVAGYSPRNAVKIGSATLRHPLVQKRLTELRDKESQDVINAVRERVLPVRERMEILTTIARTPSDNTPTHRERISAMAEINKMDHTYEPTPVAYSQTVNIYVQDKETEALLPLVKERAGKLIEGTIGFKDDKEL